MSHWLLDSISDELTEALHQASRIHIHREILNELPDVDFELIHRTASTMELIVLDLLSNRTIGDDEELDVMRSAAANAFRLFSVLPQQGSAIEEGEVRLRQGALAVLGDMGADAARLLKESPWAELPTDSDDWRDRTWATILDVWLRLIRKQSWDDSDLVLAKVASLRESQQEFESRYLEGQPASHAKPIAVELIALYHLAKAAEILAHYITDGVVEGDFQIRQLLDTQFDRVLAICSRSQLIELEPMARLLAASARQMSENSIWSA